MADYAAIKAGLGTRLDTATNISVVYNNAPELIVTPCAIVLPGDTPALYHQAMQGLTKFEFKVVVMVQRFESSANLSRLDEYVSGNQSIDTPAVYHQAMQGLTKFEFKVVVMVQRFESSANLSRLDEYVSGNQSIDTLIAGDRTLGGAASDAYVVRCNTLGVMGTGDDTFLGAEFDVEVYA